MASVGCGSIESLNEGTSHRADNARCDGEEADVVFAVQYHKRARAGLQRGTEFNHRIQSDRYAHLCLQPRQQREREQQQ